MMNGRISKAMTLMEMEVHDCMKNEETLWEMWDPTIISEPPNLAPSHISDHRTELMKSSKMIKIHASLFGNTHI